MSRELLSQQKTALAKIAENENALKEIAYQITEYDLINHRGTEIVYLDPNDNSRKVTDARYAVDLLEEEEVPKKAISQVFDLIDHRTGRLIIKEDDVNLSEMSLDELDKYLQSALFDIYSLVNYSLDASSPTGFNGHDTTHIDKVTGIARYLTEDLPEDEQRITIVAARIHDLGNLYSRKLHSLISPELFKKLLPKIKLNDGLREKAATAARLHNEPVLEPYMKLWKDQMLEDEEFYRKMRAETGDAGLAVIIADKVDVGRHRLSNKPASSEAVEDPHLAVNLLGETESLKLNDEKNDLKWSLRFTPEMSPEEAQDYPHFAKQSKFHENGTRAWIPERMKKLHDNEKIPNFDSWKQKFIEIYFQRIKLAATASFALFPDLQTFTIEMKDQYKNDPDLGEMHVIKIGRRDLEGQFAKLKQKYINEKRYS